MNDRQLLSIQYNFSNFNILFISLQVSVVYYIISLRDIDITWLYVERETAQETSKKTSG